MSLSAAMEARSLTDASLAKVLGMSAEGVRLWRRGKRRLPAERAVEIEEKAGIPRHELRPDLYPPPADPGRAEAA